LIGTPAPASSGLTVNYLGFEQLHIEDSAQNLQSWRAKMIFRLGVILFISFSIAGCEEQPARPTRIMDYPEAQIHAACLETRAIEFASMSGNALDLAYVAASGCRQTRRALAMAMDNRRSFVENFVRIGSETDVQLITEMIFRIRSGR
jgi:hypothetical protein